MPPRPIITHAPTIVRPNRRRQPTRIPRFANPGITFYKQNNYRLINSYLRTGHVNATAAEKERLEKNINYISSVMRTGLDTDVYPMLYRGTGYDEFGFRQESFERLQGMVGSHVAWKAFTSTSVDRRKAEKFSHGVLIIFTPNSATRFVDMTQYDNMKFKIEKEILLDKNLTGVIEDVKHGSSESGLKVYAEVSVRLL